MGKQKKTDVYQMVTDRIIEQLQQGVIPWRKSWQGHGAQMPLNLASGKQYRGVNVFLLMSLGYASPYFVTFKQAKKLGGTVRKGERSCPVVFWNWIERKRDDDSEGDDGEQHSKLVPFLRYYSVFNVEQCDGLDDKLPAAEKVEEREHTPIEAAEAIVNGYTNPPAIEHRGGSACYGPALDLVKMPQPERFFSAEQYYSVLFHELGHSTGHKSRLARPGIVDLDSFGSDQYSREELVAEISAAFLCARCGIDNDETQDDTAAYISNWLKRLRDDRKLVVTAAAQAQKAADHIIGD